MNKTSQGVNLTIVAIAVIIMAVSAFFNTATAELSDEQLTIVQQTNANND
ncbi:hypothetical protein [Algibacillus agarilyticus]|nr:hypothetical protein [Algibacillus agarilyticus]